MSDDVSLVLGILRAAGIFSWVLGLGVQIAFVWVIATVVRRYRPDAAPSLLGAAFLDLLITFCSDGSNLILRQLAEGAGGMHGYMEAELLLSIGFAVAHGAARGWLLWGIVRLARPVASDCCP